MSNMIQIPNGAEKITAVTLTTILRQKGVIGVETAVHTLTQTRIDARMGDTV